MNTEIIMILLLIGLFVMVLLLGFAMIKMTSRKNTEDIEAMKHAVTSDLLSFQSNLLSSISKDMNTLNENTNDKLFKMEHNMNQHLHTGFESTNKVFNEVMQQIVKINQTQDKLQELSKDITGLHTILNDKKTRGIYGEVELYSLLESAFGDNHQRFAKQYKLSNGLMVDAVLFGNDAMGMIPIDSKFPLENFNRIQNNELTQAQKTVAINEFKNDVKKHIQAIASKYIIPNETSEFAYMFIPAEAIFSYINANMQEVLQFSYEKKVYLVSPTTLMAYITAIKALYLGQKKNEKMKEIQEELVRLSVEFDRFTKRYETVSRDFDKVYQDMKDVLITANKIENRFRKIEAVELEEK